MNVRIAALILSAVMVRQVQGVEDAAQHFAIGPDGPYKTISSALRAMTDGDVCVISEGVYRECIDVKQNRVTLRGKGRVVITGCDAAGAMEPCMVNGREGRRSVVDGQVYDVFQGGEYLLPARYPDKTVPMTSNMDWEESFIGPQGNVTFTSGTHKHFTNLSDGYYVGLHGRAGSAHGKLSSWYSITLPVTRVGEDGHIHVEEANASSGFMGNYGQGRGLGYIIGARAVLDAPGEWYSDGKEILLVPPLGGDGEYELRTRLYGAVISGDGVRLDNLRFKAAAARISGDNVSIRGCAFEYISPFQHNANDTPKNKQGQSLASGWGIPENGTAGVFVEGDRFVAEDCRFARSWWCGMMIRGDHARVENCLFEDVNWMAKRCAGLFSWGNGNTVRLCTFRNLGGSGIEGGNANWIGQYAKNNTWEFNYIANVCKLIVDQGFFYVNHQSGSNPEANSVWRYNVGKGARGPDKGEWTQGLGGYYVDNNSSGYRIHNNIAIDVIQAIKYNDFLDGPGAGKNVWYYNNTLYDCSVVGIGQRGKPDAEVILVNNLSVASDTLRFRNRAGWTNNVDSVPATALRAPARMDFTPTVERLKTGGIPVTGRAVSYIGAVNPVEGMWRYGADESRLPGPQG